MAPVKEIKNTITPFKQEYSKNTLKTTKTFFFALHLQLKNI